MERKLNLELVRQTAEKAGYSFTKLAREVGVSTESVSKWLNGQAVPRPGKAVKLGRILDLNYEQLFGPRSRSSEPQIAFRLTRNREPSEEHRDRAREMGRMYEQLVPHLPFNRFHAPTRLKSPLVDYSYIGDLCHQLRKDMGIASDEPMPLPTLFELFSGLQAVVVPVFWNHRKADAELAAHIYSPSTKTTWIPFNMDTKLWDARFWVCHELAHVYTFDVLNEDDSETFADAFAGTLVFPESQARAAYDELAHIRVKSQKLAVLNRYAAKMFVSPVCVAKQIDRYAMARKLSPVQAEYDGLYPALVKATKAEKTIGAELFGDDEPSVSHLLDVTGNILKSPFFQTLSEYLKENGGNPAFIQGLLDCSLSDAKALNSELA